ncbi:hypothetical protein [Streptomyces sp. SCL15-4]|uniref:hypothetical protein n=1 Tax=Streptomyces sp. SCL15-4 TaxID=2967221 RepID=UPI002966CF6C|nr:hypothetical protein [Streptomyces sp. SCL15-4]
MSWILGIYPAPARRRAPALRISQLRRSHRAAGLTDSDASVAFLGRLAADIARTCVDFLQYPDSNYFYDGAGDTSFALTLGYAAHLAQEATRRGHPGARCAAAVLATSLDDLATVLDERFLHIGGTRQQIFAAYARDHGSR